MALRPDLTISPAFDDVEVGVLHVVYPEAEPGLAGHTSLMTSYNTAEKSEAVSRLRLIYDWLDQEALVGGCQCVGEEA